MVQIPSGGKIPVDNPVGHGPWINIGHDKAAAGLEHPPYVVHHVLFCLDVVVGELITGIIEAVGVQREDRAVAIDPRHTRAALLGNTEHAHKHITPTIAMSGNLSRLAVNCLPVPHPTSRIRASADGSSGWESKNASRFA